VISAKKTPYRIYFWENAGFDRYVFEDTTTTTSNLGDIGYLDNDSLVDMVACWGDPLYVYESSTLHSNPTNIVWQDTLASIGFPYITDLDQDGLKEILLRYRNGLSKPTVYENTGDNQYTLVWQDTLHAAAYFVNDDFDLDGRIDFVTGIQDPYGGYYGLVHCWECVGDNNFQFVFADTIIGYYNNYDVFAAHDMDNNSKPEFLFTTRDYGVGSVHLWLYEALSDNNYDCFMVDEQQLPLSLGEQWSVCGDYDADGIDEIIWSTFNQWHIYEATGVHQYQRIYSSAWTQHDETGMNMYDLNENGYPEIIESWYQNGVPSIYGTVIWEIEGVRLHQPNGGEVLNPGQQYPITWEKFDPPGADSFSLFFSADSGRTYDTITTGLGTNDTMYLWTVPNVLSDSCKIMIWAYGPPRPGEQEPRGTAWDFSDSVFAIGPVGIFTDNRRQITDYSLKILQNPITNNDIKIQYSLPKTTKVKLVLYNALGQVEGVLVDGYKSSGVYELDLNENLPSAIYFIQLTADNKSIAKKFIKIK